MNTNTYTLSSLSLMIPKSQYVYTLNLNVAPGCAHIRVGTQYGMKYILRSYLGANTVGGHYIFHKETEKYAALLHSQDSVKLQPMIAELLLLRQHCRSRKGLNVPQQSWVNYFFFAPALAFCLGHWEP